MGSRKEIKVPNERAKRWDMESIGSCGQGWLHGRVTSAVTQAPTQKGPEFTTLNILITFKQGASHFHFVPGTMNYVAPSACSSLPFWLR